MSRPLIRPVTATIRLRLSRLISGWPVTVVTVATRVSGKRWPSGARRRRASTSWIGRPAAGGNPDPQADHLRALLDLRW